MSEVDVITEEACITACRSNPTEGLKILQSQYGLTSDRFKREIYSRQPHLCKFFFTKIIGEPFDVKNPVHLAELLNSVNSPAVMGKVLFFLMNNFSSPEPVTADVSSQYDELIEEAMLLPLPLASTLRLKKSKHNPFKRGTTFAFLFEYLLKYSGRPEIWKYYSNRVMDVCESLRGRRIKARHTILKRFSQRLKEAEVKVCSVMDNDLQKVLVRNKEGAVLSEWAKRKYKVAHAESEKEIRLL